MSAATRHDNDALGFVARRRGVSITALIDVVFILLLFFMLSSSFVRWNTVELETPNLSAATSTAPTPSLQLILEPDGRLHSADNVIELGNFASLSPAALSGDRDVILSPLPDVSLANIVGASEALLRGGARNVSLGALAAAPSPQAAR